jgi:hypothetical protein
MSELLPCTSCQRHIRIDEEECPFCSSARVRPQRASRIARGAVLVGATALAGCTGGSGPKADAAQTASDAGVDATPSDASTQPDAFPPLPYGAPPARKRLV